MKKKTRNIIIGIAIFIGLGIFLGLSINTQPKHVFMDKELGMITTFNPGALIKQAYFLSTSGAGITTSNVGEKVQICDQFVNIYGYSYSDYIWLTKLNNYVINSRNIIGYASQNSKWCSEFIPIKSGKYEVVSVYTLCSNTDGWICKDSKTAYKEGSSYYCPNYGEKIVDGTTICTNNLCAVTGDCISRSSDETKSYYLEVFTKEESCNKDPYIGSWYIDSYIDNGKILKAKVYKVTSDCSYLVNYYLTQTQCDDNYLIENSNLRITEGEGFECVSAFTEDPDLDDDDDGIIDDYEERDPECNIDFYESCGDGTEILGKLCVEGLYFDSGNICTEIGEPDTPEEKPTEEITPEEIIYEENITNEIVEEIKCNSNIECQALCGILTPTCENNLCFCNGEQVFIEVDKTPIYFYLIPVSIFGLIALIIWMKRKKPRK